MLNVKACAAAKPVTDLIRQYPTTAGIVGVVLPILVQLYLATREQKRNDYS